MVKSSSVPLSSTWDAHLSQSAANIQPATSSWLDGPESPKAGEILLLRYYQKVSSSLTLSHHVGILMSHIFTRRVVNMVQEDILIERDHLHITLLQCIITVVLFHYLSLLIISYCAGL